MQYLRNINSTTISEFQLNISCKTWDNIFEGSYVNIIFNNFLNSYLRTVYSSFIKKKKISFNHQYNPLNTT